MTVKMCWGILEKGGRHYSGVPGWKGSGMCRAAFLRWGAQDSAAAVDHEPLARAGGLESVYPMYHAVAAGVPRERRTGSRTPLWVPDVKRGVRTLVK